MTTAPAPVDAGGLTGLVLDVIRSIGELGVALLVLVENLVPPIPSEVVLPFAGALAADGRFTFLGLLVASTAGSVAGAVLLYELGRRFGRERVVAALARVPLVERHDIERGDAWFARHGRTAVLTGRLIPGVRSVVSVPAGAQRMSRGEFLGLTTVGSAAWNAALLGAGLALGEQWETVGRWTTWLDRVVLAAALAFVVQLVWRRVRRE